LRYREVGYIYNILDAQLIANIVLSIVDYEYQFIPQVVHPSENSKRIILVLGEKKNEQKFMINLRSIQFPDEMELYTFLNQK
jgi:hypothetical protein